MIFQGRGHGNYVGKINTAVTVQPFISDACFLSSAPQTHFSFPQEKYGHASTSPHVAPLEQNAGRGGCHFPAPTLSML